MRPQSCPILCDPMDCSPPGFSVHGIFQARILKRKKKKNIGAGCPFFLRGIFLTQGSNPCLLGLLHWQKCSLPAETPGKCLLLGLLTKSLWLSFIYCFLSFKIFSSSTIAVDFP